MVADDAGAGAVAVTDAWVGGEADVVGVAVVGGETGGPVTGACVGGDGVVGVGDGGVGEAVGGTVTCGASIACCTGSGSAGVSGVLKVNG